MIDHGGRISRASAAARGLGACLVAALLVSGLVLPPAAGAAVLLARASRPVDDALVDLGRGRPPAASVMVDARGAPLARLYERYRVPVEPQDVASSMKAAIVAVEDRRFFVHDGVDWAGLARAVVANAASGAPLEGQGASTITMQYVKNYRLYALADTPAEQDEVTRDTVGRKLTEVRLAHRVEQQRSKEEILGGYLNLVYFGHGAYGVQAAAQTYFGTSAAQLTVPQAALLAGLVRSPEAYDPTERREQARQRRNAVLRAMVEVGSLTRAQGDAAAAAPLGVRPRSEVPAQGCAGARDGTGFFCAYVVDRLAEAGLSLADLRVGGYTVRTTLDPAVARRATAAVRAAVPTDSGVTHVGAVVESRPDGTRRIVALPANRDYGTDGAAGQSSLPVVTDARRGAGSIYKIFTAGAAIERGIVTPESTVPVPDRYTTDQGYTVSNLGSYPETMTLRRALATSPNTAFVALAERLGAVDPVVDMAERLGLRRSLDTPAGPGTTVAEAVRAEDRASFTLGPEPTSPLELASVGATLAEGGRWCRPTPLSSVADRDGRPVPLPASGCDQAVDPAVATALASALSQDHTIGTAAAAADAAGWRRPVVAKTGTTQQSRSAAFLGATGHYSAAIMTFAADGGPVCADPVRTCARGDLTGGSAPARTWFDAMQPLHQGLPIRIPATPPAGEPWT